MKRGDRVAEGLKRYGNPVVITPKSGAPIQCRASIQPMSVRRIPDSESIGCVGGDPDQTGMLYIGPPDCRLDQFFVGATVTDENGVGYRVTRARCVMVSQKPVYVWAVLQQIAA